MALVGIPNGMAQALIANVNPIYGLYTGIVTTIVGSFRTSSSLMIISLTNALALVTGSTLSNLHGEVRIEALFTLTIMVGLAQLILGLLKLGGIIRFVSDSVMTGFISAAAVLIILSQLKHIVGIDVGGRVGAAQTWEIFRSIGRVNIQTVAIGLGTMIILIILKKSPLRKFSDILGIVLSVVFLALVGWASIKTVGDIAKIPNGLPSFSLPNISLAPDLVAGALALAILGLTQSAGISAAFPRPGGKRPNMSRDFEAQGLANIAGSFFQAMPAGGSLSATSLSAAGGARTRWAGIIAGSVLALVVMVAGSAAEVIPLAGLAALLIVAGSTILAERWPHVIQTWRVSKVSALAMGVTFTVAILLSLQLAIYIGVLLSLTLYVYSAATQIQLVELVPTNEGTYKEQDVSAELSSNQATILQIRGNFYFASVYALEEKVPVMDKTRGAIVIL
ncbi:MAG: SulP family inorganic anion transporter [Actinomycetia bacterium]|nr:SulP family inorganic anion transporter [Actinomycetes bacterium]